MIRLADIKDIPSLKEIWRISFGDSEEYIDMFMEKQFKCAETVVYEEDDKVIAMFFLFRCDFSISGKAYPSFYLYAAATLPEYRGRGIMGSMIKFSKEYASKNGFDFIILSPAEKGLYDYYRRFGFSECFKSAKISLKAKTKEECPLSLLRNRAAENFSLRNRIVKNTDGVLWDYDFFKYAVEENAYTHGESYMADGCYGIYFKEKDNIVFKELIAENKETAFHFAMNICKKENCQSAELLLPVNLDGVKNSDEYESVNVGMAVPLNNKSEKAFSDFNKNAYLGLTLG